MSADDVAFYAEPGAMSRLPDHSALADVPDDLDELRRAVQGLLLHRDWSPAYGVTGDAIRSHEQHLRSTAEVLTRAFEISPAPITEKRPPVDRVLGICRHFALVHTALLRSKDVPARVRCGFSNYFDRTKWFDHWITERWAGDRWVRDDPQIDRLQAEAVEIDFDPYDQPAGRFLSADEAWRATRAGELDPMTFGIFDMWGPNFIAGNLISDVACLNKIELLPWDSWGMMTGPHQPIDEERNTLLDELAALAGQPDSDAIRARYAADDGLRVPPDITSFVDGRPVVVHLDL